MVFDTDITIVSLIILSGLALFFAGYVNYVFTVYLGQQGAMKRLGYDEASGPKARPLLMSILATTIYCALGLLVLYGFSDRLFDEVWDYSYRKKTEMRLIGLLILSAPLVLHYIIIKLVTNNALSRIISANEDYK